MLGNHGKTHGKPIVTPWYTRGICVFEIPLSDTTSDGKWPQRKATTESNWMSDWLQYGMKLSLRPGGLSGTLELLDIP